MRFADHVRIVSETGFNNQENQISQDDLEEGEFDEAGVPAYQLIQTYDRKKLKMKKH